MGFLKKWLPDFSPSRRSDEKMEEDLLEQEEEMAAQPSDRERGAASEREGVAKAAPLPQEGEWHFVHEMIPKEGFEVLRAAGINDDLVFDTGDWVADHELGIYMVLYRFGSRTNWKKTYKLILQGQVIEFKTSTILHKDDFSDVEGEFTKGLIIKNITHMLLPRVFEGRHQQVVHIIQAALSAGSSSYDTMIYRVDFDLV